MTHEAELDLARALAGVPGVIAKAADLRAPHRLTHAAQDLAARCHRFYTESRVLGEDESLSRARLALAAAAQRTLAILLGLVGVTAPERMDRDDG